ncbi:MAG: phosphate acyltransferase [Bacillota bacterium]
MFRDFKAILDKAKGKGPFTISIAAAQDYDVLKAVKIAQEVGLIKSFLVGDSNRIKAMLGDLNMGGLDIHVLHEENQDKAALMAVSLVRSGKAQILMKGLINSSNFLKAVLHKDEGLRTGRLLSHLAVFEVPGQDKLVYLSDGGINIAPSLQEKKDILINMLLALNSMGLDNPNVAVLTANEQVNSKMPATLDAKELANLSLQGAFPPGIVEGPIALDVAVSIEAARHKNIDSKISGKTDAFLVPNIETGNALGKCLIYYARAKMAGLVLGATNPIVLTSRSETVEGKLNSIALACLAS